MSPSEGPGPKSGIGVDPTYWRPYEPGHNDWSGYRGATVCRRGHPHFTALLAPPDALLGFCPDCGAPMLGRCTGCRIRIRGEYYEVDVVDLSSDYTPPAFCDGCGSPHPWATREQRIYQLENLLDGEPIEEATRLQVHEDLERLRTAEDFADKRHAETWKRLMNNAPTLFKDAGLKISITLLTSYLQRQLGLS